MIVIPAIDIIDNKPVRLYQGDYGKKEIVGKDILEIAKEFQSQGAEYLHLVDLDGAKSGSLVNKNTIVKVANELDIPVEVGGGIRTYEDAEFLIKNGVSRVILGTIAIEDKVLLQALIRDFKTKIAVGIDCKDGYICTRGWLEKKPVHYLDFVKELECSGLENIIVTDISKDGTLEGTNITMIQDVKYRTTMKITASGGVRDIEDIKKLKEINIYGVITGKAIYSNALNLVQAINYCNGGEVECIQKE